MLKPGLNIVLDAQWGSTGKGKLCGYLGRFQPDAVCSSFGPNAGHTYVRNDGKAIIFRSLPSSAITSEPHVPVLVMPDSVIDVSRLLEEAASLPGRRVLVHPRAAVLIPEDERNAAETGRHLAGTMKGTGHAIARKILRLCGTKLAGDLLPAEMVADTCEIVRDYVQHGARVLFEMSQGFDLSINHGHAYPYLTSRDITVGAALNSCGCAPRHVAQVIGSLRVHPIRVGNVEGGWSGPCHDDQIEISWNDITAQSQSPEAIEEKTTVTGRVRRVFSFSIKQIRRFCAANEPAWLFLNFIQYLDHAMHGATHASQLTPEARTFIQTLEDQCSTSIRLVGTGARERDIIECPFSDYRP